LKLTDAFIKGIKPKSQTKSYPDGHGLVLLCNSQGSLGWRYRYRFGGKPKMLSFGTYPEVSLKKAREKLAIARTQLGDGKDPSSVRKQENSQKQNDFKSIALRWHKAWSVGKDEKHAAKVLRRLEQNVFPEIGSMPVHTITAPMLIKMAQKIIKRGAIDIAKRSYSTSGQVFRYAIVEGLCDRNPASDISLSDAHIESPPVKHRSSLPQKDVPELLRKIDAYDVANNGSVVTKLAMKLMAYTFVRTSELIEARWDEFDLKGGLWDVPAERMKKVKGRPSASHMVALSKQSKLILKELHKLTGGGEFVFPHESNPKKSMSNNTILFALYRMGYKGRMTGHGFRGIASTILHERGYQHAHIEVQLAHLEKDKVSGAYNHAEYVPQRARMMQEWADYLDGIKDGAKVINIKTIRGAA
jgi:integrase